jgi:hypothetical protein
MEEDLIIGEEQREFDKLDIIDNQLSLIISLADVEPLYDDFATERILVITNAMKIINKAQKALLKEI